MCRSGDTAQPRYVQPGAGPRGPWGHQDPEGRALAPATLQLPLHGESEEAAGPGERPVWELQQSQPQNPMAQSFPTCGIWAKSLTPAQLSARLRGAAEHTPGTAPGWHSAPWHRH